MDSRKKLVKLAKFMRRKKKAAGKFIAFSSILLRLDYCQMLSLKKLFCSNF